MIVIALALVVHAAPPVVIGPARGIDSFAVIVNEPALRAPLYGERLAGTFDYRADDGRWVQLPAVYCGNCMAQEGEVTPGPHEGVRMSTMFSARMGPGLYRYRLTFLAADAHRIVAWREFEIAHAPRSPGTPRAAVDDIDVLLDEITRARPPNDCLVSHDVIRAFLRHANATQLTGLLDAGDMSATDRSAVFRSAPPDGGGLLLFAGRDRDAAERFFAAARAGVLDDVELRALVALAILVGDWPPDVDALLVQRFNAASTAEAVRLAPLFVHRASDLDDVLRRRAIAALRRHAKASADPAIRQAVKALMPWDGHIIEPMGLGCCRLADCEISAAAQDAIDRLQIHVIDHGGGTLWGPASSGGYVVEGWDPSADQRGDN